MLNKISSHLRSYGSSSARETSGTSSTNSVSQLSKESLRATAQFKGNPYGFLAENTIDGRHVIRSDDPLTRHLLDDTIKQGHFALIKDDSTGNFVLTPVNAATEADREKTIHAHWIPYNNGQTTPGFVDIPKDPRYATRQESASFAFTAGMNGCSLEAREHPSGRRDYMRVFHNQHPSDDYINSLVEQASGSKISSFDWPDYHHEDSGKYPIAFNMMHFDKDYAKWQYMGQSLGVGFTDTSHTLSKTRPDVSFKYAT
ncbi:hypothetical protein [Pseudomonas syringae]|uniref:hypothetical protein n=2 Tax=Pseudomonas syringae TaxID=317 RepID=UPI0004696B0A|nr:hypothetical protein [Pseudomonas syringae]